MRHRWKFIGQTKYAKIYVDYRNNKTRIVGRTLEYIHDGIYPYHDPEPMRRMGKQ